MPGQVYRMEVKIRPAFYRLAPGHALRLRITSGNFPSTIPLPSEIPLLLGSAQEVHQGAVYPSDLVVPLAPPLPPSPTERILLSERALGSHPFS